MVEYFDIIDNVDKYIFNFDKLSDKEKREVLPKLITFRAGQRGEYYETGSYDVKPEVIKEVDKILNKEFKKTKEFCDSVKKAGINSHFNYWNYSCSVDLSGIRLTRSSFNNSVLEKSEFSNVDLSGSFFTNSDLRFLSIYNSDLRNAKIKAKVNKGECEIVSIDKNTDEIRCGEYL